MKKCTRCKIEKELEFFIKEKRRASGYGPVCKECENKRKIEYLDTKREEIRAYNVRKYHELTENQKKTRKESLKIWKEKNPDYHKNYKKFWNKSNRERLRLIAKEFYKKNAERIRLEQREKSKQPGYREKININVKEYLKRDSVRYKHESRRIFVNAVKRGFIVRPTQCEVCLKECKPDGHHEDYNKPLEVQWLCKICHAHKHNKLLDVKP